MIVKHKRWIASTILAVVMACSAPAGVWAGGSSRVVDFDGTNYLLEDGTVWIQGKKGYEIADVKLSSIENGYGLTPGGGLVGLDGGKAVSLAQGVKALAGSCLLKQDGTVWELGGGQVGGTAPQASLADCGGNLTASMNPSGQIYADGKFGSGKLVAAVNAESVVSLRATSGKDGQDSVFVVLYRTGKLEAYDYLGFDRADLTKYVPRPIVEDAVSADYSRSGMLAVVRKDGTVWHNDISNKFKLTEAYPGLTGASEIVYFSDSYLVLRMQDGKLEAYETGSGKRFEMELPAVEELKMELEATDLAVGDKVHVSIEEKWEGMAARTVPLAEANVTIEKPSLLQKLPDGQLKALAAGETDVTVVSGGQSRTVHVTISSNQALEGGAYLDGTMYLPLKGTFKELGYSVAWDPGSKTFTVKQGSRVIQLKQGSASAVVDGKPLAMPGKVQTVGGTAVFPAALLKSALGASLDWNSSYQYMTVTMGKAVTQITTPRTDQIIRQEKLGGLTRLIGKSYWINHFDSDYRFQKVTIEDIYPEQGGSFTLYFRLASGKLVSHTAYDASMVSELLGNSENFLTADPYKTYKWSQSTWSLVKQEKVAVGMNKEQVLLSWGRPSSKSVLSSRGITVETWSYGYSNYVTFTNGKVGAVYGS